MESLELGKNQGCKLYDNGIKGDESLEAFKNRILLHFFIILLATVYDIFISVYIWPNLCVFF